MSSQAVCARSRAGCASTTPMPRRKPRALRMCSPTCLRPLPHRLPVIAAGDSLPADHKGGSPWQPCGSSWPFFPRHGGGRRTGRSGKFGTGDVAGRAAGRGRRRWHEHQPRSLRLSLSMPSSSRRREHFARGDALGDRNTAPDWRLARRDRREQVRTSRADAHGHPHVRRGCEGENCS